MRVFFFVFQLVAGCFKSSLDRIFRLGGSSPQPAFQLIHAVRADENADRIGEVAFDDLHCPLHVNFQDNPLARLEASGNFVLQGPIPVSTPEYFAAFEEFASLAAFSEFFVRQKMVVDIVDFGRSRVSSRGRDAKGCLLYTSDAADE